jgi:hypothetical protein
MKRPIFGLLALVFFVGLGFAGSTVVASGTLQLSEPLLIVLLSAALLAVTTALRRGMARPPLSVQVIQKGQKEPCEQERKDRELRARKYALAGAYRMDDTGSLGWPDTDFTEERTDRANLGLG